MTHEPPSIVRTVTSTMGWTRGYGGVDKECRQNFGRATSGGGEPGT
jgi:hypothetical protein